jgi:hypothetical protein
MDVSFEVVENKKLSKPKRKRPIGWELSLRARADVRRDKTHRENLSVSTVNSSPLQSPRSDIASPITLSDPDETYESTRSYPTSMAALLEKVLTFPGYDNKCLSEMEKCNMSLEDDQLSDTEREAAINCYGGEWVRLARSLFDHRKPLMMLARSLGQKKMYKILRDPKLFASLDLSCTTTDAAIRS